MYDKPRNSRSRPKQHYIDLAIGVHGSKYDYTLLPEWPPYVQPVSIVCSTHGVFSQKLSHHISNGAGCPECGRIDKAAKTKKGLVAYVQKAIKVHGNTYDYSKWPADISNSDKVPIICPVHGEFSQTVNDHISRKAGCPKCGISRRTEKRREQLENRVDINSLENRDWLYDQHIIQKKTLEEIACMLGCSDGLVGRTCKLLDITVTRWPHSKGERELGEFLESLGLGVEYNNRTLISPKELDLIIPDLKLAVEYCGLYWHSSTHKCKKYHLDKLTSCNAAGYRLITVFEDEWNCSREIVEEKFRQITGRSTRPVVFARKCKIVELDRIQKNAFFDDNHIQGRGPGSLTYGLTYDSTIVAAMTFVKKADGRWDLNRFATSHNVPGGFSRLLRHFERNNLWTEVVSFADRRWSEGEVYITNGFDLDTVLAPDYSYIVNNKTVHKFNFRHKNLGNILGEKYNPSLSETENTSQAGLLRIYNCGLLRFTKRNYNERPRTNR